MSQSVNLSWKMTVQNAGSKIVFVYNFKLISKFSSKYLEYHCICEMNNWSLQVNVKE